ncbi:MAG: S-layer homology domain-containing protein [Clostridia bacterium]|nr:S-layer homology domain-containing protein [Clostridia bacterium]
MIKRVLACVLCLAMLVSTMAFAANFKDVSEESHSWAYEAINDMASKGIINGVSDTEFAPDNNVTKVQAMLLIARILGFNTTVISDNIEKIYSIYEEDLADLDTTYKNELAYLLFRGVFTLEELEAVDFTDPLSREEAALYITKASGGVEAMEGNSVILNAYEDDSDISEDFRKAVYYVRDQELMNGTGDNLFSPKGTVTRAQIATLLYRMMKKIDFNTTKGTVDSVTASENTAKIFVVTKTYDVDADILVRNCGVTIEPKDLYKGDEVVVTMLDNKVVAIDSFYEIPEVVATIDGEVHDVVTKSNELKLKNPVTGEISTYALEERATILINGTESILPNVRICDYAVLDLTEDDTIIKLTVSDVTSKLSDVVIEEIITDEETVSLKLKDEEENSFTYLVNGKSLVVKKNGIKSEFSALNVGDKLSSVILKYNRVAEIEAFSEVKTASGSISGINISNTPSITLYNSGEETSFPIGRDTVFYVYGEETDIYGLRLAQFVKITLDSTVVAKVEAVNQSQSGNAFGTVQSVNTNANAITFVDFEGNSMVVYVSKLKTKIISSDSSDTKLKTINDIKPDDVITCIGVISNGIFEAQTIVISK